MNPRLLVPAVLAALCFACSPTRGDGQAHEEDHEAHEGKHETEHEEGPLEELMEAADETFGALRHGRFDDSREGLDEVAERARELAEGYGDLAGEHRPRDTREDFVGFARDTSGFWSRVAEAAGKDAGTLRGMFADPRAVGRQYCGRCHDVYKRQW
ncbi:MAG: hypothetical protein R3F30_12465 [Planctomycetota bacterium]